MPSPALRRWHRRLGLVAGLPCLLWGLSGAVLAWKNWTTMEPPDHRAAVAGTHTPFAVGADAALQAAGRPGTPVGMKWTWLLGQPRFEIRYADSPESIVIDGLTGRRLPPLDAAMAARIAGVEGGPDTRVRGCVLETRGNLVYRPEPGDPVWRCRLDSGHDIYLDPQSGAVRAHVDWLFRVIRVSFFGLHTWDLSAGPGQHASFLLLCAMAGVLLLVGVTGLWLYVSTLTRPARTRPRPGP